jgi:hypothetical protein
MNVVCRLQILNTILNKKFCNSREEKNKEKRLLKYAGKNLFYKLQKQFIAVSNCWKNNFWLLKKQLENVVSDGWKNN